MLKDSSDFDCVVLVNPPTLPYLKDVRDTSLSGTYLRHDLVNANEKIKKALTNHSNLVGTPHINPLLITATLQVGGKQIDVDILPTADNVAIEGIGSDKTIV